MKKNYVTKLGALALALTLITTCMMGSTLARYVSEVTGTGTANIAAWDIALEMTKGKETMTKDFSFNLYETKTKQNTNLVSENTVAPGDEGEFKISIKGSGTKVAYIYEVAVNTDAFSEKTGNIEFYTKDDKDQETKWTGIKETLVNAGADASNDVNETIYWRWVGEIEGESKAISTQNGNDTTAGESAAEADASPLGFTVTMTARQFLPGETAPTTASPAT